MLVAVIVTKIFHHFFLLVTDKLIVKSTANYVEVAEHHIH